jgi:hypothetical protein
MCIFPKLAHLLYASSSPLPLVWMMIWSAFTFTIMYSSCNMYMYRYVCISISLLIQPHLIKRRGWVNGGRRQIDANLVGYYGCAIRMDQHPTSHQWSRSEHAHSHIPTPFNPCLKGSCNLSAAGSAVCVAPLLSLSYWWMRCVALPLITIAFSKLPDSLDPHYVATFPFDHHHHTYVHKLITN